MNSLDLINQIEAGDAAESIKTFDSLMMDRIADLLDQRKEEIASELFQTEE